MKQTKRLSDLFLIITIVGILFVFGSCGGGEDGGISGGDGGEDVIIPTTTKVLDQSTMQNLSDVSGDSSTFTFDQSTPQLESLSSGDVIVAGITNFTPDGALRKVTGVSEIGNETVVYTTQATLVDAIEKGTIELTKTLTPNDISSASALKSSVTLIVKKLQTPETQAPDGFYVDMKDVVLYDEDGNLGTTDDQIKANGSISINPSFNFNVEIEDFQLKQLSFINTTTESARLELKAEIEILDIHKKEEFVLYKFKPIIIWIGNVPVWITPVLTVSVGLDGDVSSGITASVTQDATLTAGLTYNNGTLSPVSNLSASNFQFDSLSLLKEECSVKGFIGAQLSLLIYGVIGPYAEIDGYLELVADPLSSPWWELYGGIDVPIGVKFKIFNYLLIDYDYTINIYNVLLAQTGPFSYLAVDQHVVSLDSANPSGEVQVFNMGGGTLQWSVSSDDPTIKVLPVFWTGEGTVIITATDFSIDRIATVTITNIDDYTNYEQIIVSVTSGSLFPIELKYDDGIHDLTHSWGGACPYGGNLSDGLIGFRKFLTSPSYPFHVLKVKIYFAAKNVFNADFYLHIKDESGNDLLPTPFLISAAEVNLGDWWEKDISSYGITINSGKIEVSIFESYLPANCPPDTDWSINGWVMYADTSLSGSSIMKGPTKSYYPPHEWMIRLIGEI